MRKLIYHILISLILFGCSEKNSEWIREREASIYLGTKLNDEKFMLSFYKIGDTLKYKYVSEIDSTKTIFIEKIENSNSLSFGGDKFITSNRKSFSGQKLNGLEFDFYDLEDPVADGTGPILFNSEYGLLAINNVFGPTIIFLEKKDNTLNEQIIDNLNE